jgi:purine nucleosidase
VPIHPGSPLPLLTGQRQPHAPQADALSAGGRVRWHHRTDFESGTAVEFLRRTVREDPGGLTLLAIGPLTNLGLLFRVDPEIPTLLKRLVLMCGSFLGTPSRHGGAEWNALCDPHAASIVYEAPVSEHRSVGLDVTTRVSIDAAEARGRFQRGLLRPVLDLAEVWFRTADRVVFHDPLAAVSIFEPDVCRFARGRVGVGLGGTVAAGLTSWAPAAGREAAEALESRYCASTSSQVVTGQAVLNRSLTAGLAFSRMAAASGVTTVIPAAWSFLRRSPSLALNFSVAHSQAVAMALVTSFLSEEDRRS